MVTTCFAPASCESSLSGGSERCELINKPFALEKDHLPQQGPVGGLWKGALYRGFDRKVGFCFNRRPCLLGNPGDMCKKALATGISLHMGPVREPGGWLVYR